MAAGVKTAVPGELRLKISNALGFRLTIGANYLIPWV
jgi:hypothetical protein